MVKVVGILRVGTGTVLVGTEVSSVVDGHCAVSEQETVSVVLAVAVTVTSVVDSVVEGQGTESVTETGTVVFAVVSSEVEVEHGTDSVLVADAVPVMMIVGSGGRVIVIRVG